MSYYAINENGEVVVFARKREREAYVSDNFSRDTVGSHKAKTIMVKWLKEVAGEYAGESIADVIHYTPMREVAATYLSYKDV